MSRLFDDASSEYLELDSAPATAVPLTLACWFNSDSLTALQRLMVVCDKDAAAQMFYLAARGDVAGDPVRAGTVATSAAVADSTTGYSANTWHHACGVFSATNARAAYIDGGSKGTQSGDLTPAGLDRVSIGRFGGSTPDGYMSGMIAEAAVWTTALSDAEVAELATGKYPYLVQPASCVAYWSFVDNDEDGVGVYDLTAYNTPAWGGTHPTMIALAIPRMAAFYRRLRA